MLRGSRFDCGDAGGRAGTESVLAGRGEAEAADLVTGRLRLAVGVGEVDASAGCTGAGGSGVGRASVDWVGVGKTGAVAMGAENSGAEDATAEVAGVGGGDGVCAERGGVDVAGVINSIADGLGASKTGAAGSGARGMGVKATGAGGSGAGGVTVGGAGSMASGEGATVSRGVSELLSSATASGVGFCGADALIKASLKTEEHRGQWAVNPISDSSHVIVPWQWGHLMLVALIA